MADLVFVAGQVAVVFPLKAEIHTGIAGAAITAGQAVTIDANGDVILADASVAGTTVNPAIALETVGAAQAINILKRGQVAGFTLSQAYGAELFLSDTAGDLADAAGTVSIHAGRVAAMTDKDRTKVLYVDFTW